MKKMKNTEDLQIEVAPEKEITTKIKRKQFQDTLKEIAIDYLDTFHFGKI